MRLSTFVAVPSAVVIALLAGCAASAEGGASAGSSAERVSEPRLGEIERVTAPEQITRPIDAYLPDTTRILELVQARERWTNRCLREKGYAETFAYPDRASVIEFVSGGVNDRAVRSSLWGFFDVEAARTSGYQRPHSGGSLTVAPLSPSAAKHCMPQDDQTLDPLLLMNEGVLPEPGPPAPTEDSRFLTAQAEWSACMRGAGFDYEKVTEPLEAYQAESQASLRQIAAASADVDCKLSTNLVGIALAVQRSYDQRYIEERHEALSDFSAQLGELLRTGNVAR